jgi:hypothetical protein
MDINGDGITEVPVPVEFPHPDSNENLCYRIDWKSYSPNGEKATVESTYHDTDDGWYLTLPDTWKGRIAVSRDATDVDEVTVTFSVLDSQGKLSLDFLKIYVLTGENREIKAARGGRFILSRQAETIYAAELLEGNGSWSYGISREELQAAFNLITTEWLSSDS